LKVLDLATLLEQKAKNYMIEADKLQAEALVLERELARQLEEMEVRLLG
jgi:hypothetical protein